MVEFSKREPLFFYDLLREFSSVPYREVLIAWGIMRERISFVRNEDGRYLYPKLELDSQT